MAKWITSITINNFRAFKGAYPPIIIPANHHLLVYGENGSGKSSIYNAIKDFFSSSTDTTKEFEVNFFSQLSNNDTGTIELKIADLDANKNVTTENSFVFGKPDSQSTHRIQAIKLANKVKGFIDYRRLLKTHFIETSQGQNPNLFKLIIEELLADHLVNKANVNNGGGVASLELIEEWSRIRNNIQDLDGRYNAHYEGLQELPLFENDLRQLLTKVFTQFKQLIQKYFDKKLDIDVTLANMQFERNIWKIKQELYLDIKYAGQSIPSYQIFINEARLSALGICLYLAALKTYPSAASALKILYLDDIFIGLDTNNRIPLLKILKHEFINEDFQIFLSTYDRQWFEMARTWFDVEKCNFKSIELFVNDDENPSSPDIPIVIDPSHDLFQKSLKHFEAKDYPAAANYLRKTCESELRRILPKNLTLKVNYSSGEIDKIQDLETLVSNFIQYLTKNNLNKTAFTHFKTYKKIILNPLSHDDTDAPHYRQEIQDGINLVKELQQIRTKEIVFAKDMEMTPMKLGMRDVITTTMHQYKIKILENLQIIQQELSPIQLSVVECEIIENNNSRKFNTLQEAFDQLSIERGYPFPTHNLDFYNNISVTTHRKLIDFMVF